MAPAYGVYSAGYNPGWAAPMAGGFYSASYAGSSACCVPSCCDPCGGCATGNCVGGSCGTGSCVGTSGESLKPSADPISREKSDGAGSGRGDSDTEGTSREFPARRGADDLYERDRDPTDGFDSPSTRPSRPEDPAWERSPRSPAGSPERTRNPPATDAPADTANPAPAGTGTGTNTEDDGLFPSDPLGGFDRRSNKPPMSDPLEPESGAKPAEGSTAPATAPETTDEKKEELPTPASDDFLPSISEPAQPFPDSGSVESNAPGQLVGQLRDVISRPRLAGRNLAIGVKSSVNGNELVDSRRNKSMRWISVPRPAGQVQL